MDPEDAAPPAHSPSLAHRPRLALQPIRHHARVSGGDRPVGAVGRAASDHAGGLAGVRQRQRRRSEPAGSQPLLRGGIRGAPVHGGVVDPCLRRGRGAGQVVSTTAATAASPLALCSRPWGRTGDTSAVCGPDAGGGGPGGPLAAVAPIAAPTVARAAGDPGGLRAALPAADDRDHALFLE